PPPPLRVPSRGRGSWAWHTSLQGQADSPPFANKRARRLPWLVRSVPQAARRRGQDDANEKPSREMPYAIALPRRGRGKTGRFDVNTSRRRAWLPIYAGCVRRESRRSSQSGSISGTEDSSFSV